MEQWAELEPKDTYIQVEKMRRIVEHIADLGKALEINQEGGGICQETKPSYT